MKVNRVTYRIPEPCHEGWDKMLPVEKGRFCNSCAKPVVDFTRMTDRQIFKVIDESDGSVCGRMTISQINREMTFGNNRQPVFSLHALMLGTTLTTFSAIHSNAQTAPVNPAGSKIEASCEKGRIAAEPVIMGDTVLVTVFSGKVIELTKGLIAGTSVTVYDEAGVELMTTLTNDNGEFELVFSGSQHPYRVVFEKVDFIAEERFFSDLSAMTNQTFYMYRIGDLIMGKPMIEKR